MFEVVSFDDHDKPAGIKLQSFGIGDVDGNIATFYLGANLLCRQIYMPSIMTQ